MIALFGRYASSVVQKAHARVTRENARYVREAITADETIARLTQERDQARKQADDCQAQGVTLARTCQRQLASIKDAHIEQLAGRDELIARMEAELVEVSGQLADTAEYTDELEEQLRECEERLALVDRDEDMRDEIRAKRSSDL